MRSLSPPPSIISLPLSLLLLLVFVITSTKALTTATTSKAPIHHESRRASIIKTVRRTTATSLSMSSSTTNNNNKKKNLSYDLVIIGGGAAGLTAAKFASTFSKSSLIIEKSKFGGDCTWTGCIPSKTLISTSKVAHAVQTAPSFGVLTNKEEDDVIQVDMKLIKKRLDDNRDVIYKEDDSPESLKKLNVDTMFGVATFISPKKLRVTSNENEVEVEAKEGVLIATGAKPNMPTEQDIKGLDRIEYWTYEDIFDIEELPKKLTVVGGGPIGCELSHALSRLGVDVTLVANKLLPKQEPEISHALQKLFQEEGITVIPGKVISVESTSSSSSSSSSSNDKSKEHIATISDGNKMTMVEGDAMLLAVGRTPVVNGMGLTELGVKLNEKMGGIQVNKKLRTNIRGVYAAGDCTGDEQFTHYAGYQGVVAARNILLPFSDPGVLENVPASTFTNPEISSVGMTEAEAKEKYGANAVSVAIQQVKETDRAICEDQKYGMIKIVYKTKNYKILGASIMSTAASEMISEISVAMKTNLSFDMLATVMHTYPSYSMALQIMAGDVYYGKLKKNIRLYNFLKRLGF